MFAHGAWDDDLAPRQITLAPYTANDEEWRPKGCKVHAGWIQSAPVDPTIDKSVVAVSDLLLYIIG